TAFIDDFRAAKTLAMSFSIVNPRTGEPYRRDPRGVAQKAEEHLASSGTADTAIFAPEAEFFLFDDVRYRSAPQSSYYSLGAEEADWASGEDHAAGNLGHKLATKGGYFPVTPQDKTADVR